MKRFIDTTVADAKDFVRAVRQRTGKAKPKTEAELRQEAKARAKARGMMGQGGLDAGKRKRALDETVRQATGDSRKKK